MPAMVAISPKVFVALIRYLFRFSRSGWHRDSRSGRGFPNRFFMALVMNQEAHMDKARPRRPMCNSQSLRCHINLEGVPRGTVAPGTKTREMMVMNTMGPKTEMIVASHAGTVSSSVNGKLVGESKCQKPLRQTQQTPHGYGKQDGTKGKGQDG